jgi:ABC-type hemin transport system ATPase subunit
MAYGTPREVMTESRLQEVFEANLMVDANPSSGAPRVTLIRNQ